MPATSSGRRAQRAGRDARIQGLMMLDGNGKFAPVPSRNSKGKKRAAQRKSKAELLGSSLSRSSPTTSVRRCGRSGLPWFHGLPWFQRGERVHIERYRRPIGLIARTGRGAYVPVVVCAKDGAAIHWVPVEKLTRTKEVPPWEKILRTHLQSPEGRKAANSQRANSPRPSRSPRPYPPGANTPVRGLPANRRHGVHLIG